MEAMAEAGLASLRVRNASFAGDLDGVCATIGGDEVQTDIEPSLAGLREAVPIAPTHRPFRRGPFFRLPLHRRSFYYALPTRDLTIGRGAIGNGGVIAIKGTEPLLDDVDSLIAELQAERVDSDVSTQWRLAEHLALYENKVPGALTLQEAELEAHVAAELQAAHLRAYGTVARIPVPLLVQRLPDDRLVPYWESLRRHLSSRALLRVENKVQAGLATYIYYYPAVPLRVIQADKMVREETYEDRRCALARLADPQKVLEGWAQLYARMLLLGYLPCALGSRGSGNCCSLHNAVLDGGFVDLDSVVPVSETTGDMLLEETLNYSFSSLCRTVGAFLLGQEPRTHKNIHLTDKWIGDLVATLIRDALETEARHGMSPDPRILDYFDPQLSYARFVAYCQHYVR